MIYISKYRWRIFCLIFIFIITILYLSLNNYRLLSVTEIITSSEEHMNNLNTYHTKTIVSFQNEEDKIIESNVTLKPFHVEMNNNGQKIVIDDNVLKSEKYSISTDNNFPEYLQINQVFNLEQLLNLPVTVESKSDKYILNFISDKNHYELQIRRSDFFLLSYEYRILIDNIVTYNTKTLFFN